MSGRPVHNVVDVSANLAAGDAARREQIDLAKLAIANERFDEAQSHMEKAKELSQAAVSRVVQVPFTDEELEQRAIDEKAALAFELETKRAATIAERDRLLAATDYTQVADAPVADAPAWLTYRAELRDLGAKIRSSADPASIEFPAEPAAPATPRRKKR